MLSQGAFSRRARRRECGRHEGVSVLGGAGGMGVAGRERHSGGGQTWLNE